MTVFLDTNVLLDVLAKREPFYDDSAAVWTLAENRQLDGHVSSLSLPILFYLLRKSKGSAHARKTLEVVADIFTLVAIDDAVIRNAIAANISDFEDAIQYVSAINAKANVLISRNPRDFSRSPLAVLTPREFLATNFLK